MFMSHYATEVCKCPGKTLKIKYDGDDGWAEITINELTNSSLVLYEHGEQEETTNYYTRK